MMAIGRNSSTTFGVRRKLRTLRGRHIKVARLISFSISFGLVGIGLFLVLLPWKVVMTTTTSTKRLDNQTQEQLLQPPSIEIVPQPKSQTSASASITSKRQLSSSKLNNESSAGTSRRTIVREIDSIDWHDVRIHDEGNRQLNSETSTSQDFYFSNNSTVVDEDSSSDCGGKVGTNEASSDCDSATKHSLIFITHQFCRLLGATLVTLGLITGGFLLLLIPSLISPVASLFTALGSRGANIGVDGTMRRSRKTMSDNILLWLVMKKSIELNICRFALICHLMLGLAMVVVSLLFQQNDQQFTNGAKNLKDNSLLRLTMMTQEHTPSSTSWISPATPRLLHSFRHAATSIASKLFLLQQEKTEYDGYTSTSDDSVFSSLYYFSLIVGCIIITLSSLGLMSSFWPFLTRRIRQRRRQKNSKKRRLNVKGAGSEGRGVGLLYFHRNQYNTGLLDGDNSVIGATDRVKHINTDDEDDTAKFFNCDDYYNDDFYDDEHEYSSSSNSSDNLDDFMSVLDDDIDQDEIVTVEDDFYYDDEITIQQRRMKKQYQRARLKEWNSNNSEQRPPSAGVIGDMNRGAFDTTTTTTTTTGETTAPSSSNNIKVKRQQEKDSSSNEQRRSSSFSWSSWWRCGEGKQRRAAIYDIDKVIAARSKLLPQEEKGDGHHKVRRRAICRDDHQSILQDLETGGCDVSRLHELSVPLLPDVLFKEGEDEYDDDEEEGQDKVSLHIGNESNNNIKMDDNDEEEKQNLFETRNDNAEMEEEEEGTEVEESRITGIKRLLKLVSPQKPLLFVACVVLLLRMPFSLAKPHFVSSTFGALTDGDYQRARHEILSLIIVGTIDSILDFWCVYLFGLANLRIVKSIRLDTFGSILKQDIGFFDEHNTGELVSRLTSDCGQMSSELTWVFRFSIEAFVRITGITFYMIVRSPKLACATLVLVPIIAYINKHYGTFLQNNAKATQEALAEANTVAQETLSCIRTVVAFNCEGMEHMKYTQKIERGYDLNLKELFARGIYYMVICTFLIQTVLQGTILTLGTSMIRQQNLTVEILLAFMLYQGQLQEYTLQLFQSYTSLLRSSGAGDKVFELLDRIPPSPGTGSRNEVDRAHTLEGQTETLVLRRASISSSSSSSAGGSALMQEQESIGEITDHDGQQPSTSGQEQTPSSIIKDNCNVNEGQGNTKNNAEHCIIDSTSPHLSKSSSHHNTSIEFVNVEFTYPTRPHHKVLNGLNLSIPSGSTVALVGQSGCGKSTLVNLIERFYDPTKGTILIGGQDLCDIPLKEHRQRVGIVTQDPVLFSGTILSNILYGSCDHSDSTSTSSLLRDAMEAARMANAHDFIESFEDGYMTEVGERGVQVSGGQKQRIAIARAILKQPTILLLDEATSALDNKSERLVQQALDRLMYGSRHQVNSNSKADANHQCYQSSDDCSDRQSDKGNAVSTETAQTTTNNCDDSIENHVSNNDTDTPKKSNTSDASSFFMPPNHSAKDTNDVSESSKLKQSIADSSDNAGVVPMLTATTGSSTTTTTTIVVAHRLRTVRNADMIAVISDGVVVELGNHSKLMNIPHGRYRQMVLEGSTFERDEEKKEA